MRIGPYDYALGSTGKVLAIQGANFLDTGIRAYFAELAVSAGATTEAFGLDLEQMDEAAEEIARAFPGLRGKLRPVPFNELPNTATLIGGLSTAPWWLVYDNRVAFHPLMVRLLSREKRLRTHISNELGQIGVLSEAL